MTLHISRVLCERLLTEAAASPDREVCGLLFGAAGGVDRADPAANVAPDPRDTFELDPAALFAALRAERRGEAPAIGHYHSHPRGPATPSARDAAAAFRPGWLWLIIGEGRLTAWREQPGGPVQHGFEPVRLVVEQG